VQADLDPMIGGIAADLVHDLGALLHLFPAQRSGPEIVLGRAGVHIGAAEPDDRIDRFAPGTNGLIEMIRRVGGMGAMEHADHFHPAIPGKGGEILGRAKQRQDGRHIPWSNLDPVETQRRLIFQDIVPIGIIGAGIDFQWLILA
ncbi:hypothetical protein E4T56_gene6487, partial [Termitomyces sp. T112]